MKYHLIIQGPYFNDNRVKTKKTIISAVESGMFSKITLSTYAAPELEDLIKSFNIEVIINKDPGSQGWEEGRKKFQNINRQIKTFINGVIVDEYDFTLKMRSDCYIDNYLKLKTVIERFMTSSDTFLFSDTTSARIDTKKPKYLYHLSDWFIGFKKEKSKLVKSIPYIDELDNQMWIDRQDINIKNLYRDQGINSRYGAEVWICLNLLSKDKYPIRHNLDYSVTAEEKYKNDLKYIMCVPMYKLGMRCMKMRTVHIPHIDRYENYLGYFEKVAYSTIGLFYKSYVIVRQIFQ
jgi:hypothetical protein